jgi:hypothetical protein
MTGTFNPNFNPAKVMMGAPAAPSGVNVPTGPYLPTKPVSGRPARPSGVNQPAKPSPPSNVLAAQPIRATGTGPFDSAYRQDLATYAGGNFLQPQGGLSFNPTAQPGQAGALGGQATGGGNAPVQGLPNSLLTQALGGQGFGYSPPVPATATTATQPPDWQKWLQGIMGQFNPMGPTQ